MAFKWPWHGRPRGAWSPAWRCWSQWCCRCWTQAHALQQVGHLDEVNVTNSGGEGAATVSKISPMRSGARVGCGEQLADEVEVGIPEEGNLSALLN